MKKTLDEEITFNLHNQELIQTDLQYLLMRFAVLNQEYVMEVFMPRHFNPCAGKHALELNDELKAVEKAILTKFNNKQKELDALIEKNCLCNDQYTPNEKQYPMKEKTLCPKNTDIAVKGFENPVRLFNKLYENKNDE